MLYQGSCHCGQVAFEVEGEIQGAMACNCSICRRKGILMWFVPRAAMTLLTPPEAVSSYQFNRHVIQHRFCPTCGIHTHGEGLDPQGQPMAAINIRCIDAVDLDSVPVQHHNGRAI